MLTLWEELKDTVLISLFKGSQEGLTVCGCPEQTGLLYLCRAAEAGSSSSPRGPFTYPLWSHISSPPPLSFPPLESSGFLFSRSGAYHLFLHCCLSPPPHPSLREWKDILGYRSCLSCADPEGPCLSLFLYVWKWGVKISSPSPPLFLWHLVFLWEQGLFSLVSSVSADFK